MTKSSPKKRPTQVDVARRANVSQAMVSYVLNGNSKVVVADDTRERIMAAIEELGYVPNQPARALRTQKTKLIACVVPDITNPFHTSFAKGLQAVAEAHEHDVVLYNTDRIANKEHKFLELLRQGRYDGVVVTPHHLKADDLVKVLEAGMAVVVQGSGAMPTEVSGRPLDSIHVDDVGAAQVAVSYLIELGHERIGMLAGEENTPPQRLRRLGYLRALEEHGIPVDENLIRGGEFRSEGGHHSMLDLLELAEPPTAVFAASDMMAIGAIMAIRDAGASVPDDISVVGFDDIPFASTFNPPLTTIAQFGDQIGERAAEMLFERLTGESSPTGRREVMPFELIIRRSTSRR
jgi:LacI family transcriptional regulator